MISNRVVKRICRGWEDTDLYSHWRFVLPWQQGERRKQKRRAHKRERRLAKKEIVQERDE